MPDRAQSLYASAARGMLHGFGDQASSPQKPFLAPFASTLADKRLGIFPRKRDFISRRLESTG